MQYNSQYMFHGLSMPSNLADVDSKYVFVPADKESDFSVFVCRPTTSTVQSTKSGLNDSTGSPTYIHTPPQRKKCWLIMNLFNNLLAFLFLRTMNLPFRHWINKQYKCSTKAFPEVLTKMLTVVGDGLQHHRSRSGINQMCIKKQGCVGECHVSFVVKDHKHNNVGFFYPLTSPSHIN